MEPLREFTNVIFDEIQIGATARNGRYHEAKPDRSGCHGFRDVDAFYLMQPGDADKRQEAGKTEAAGAEAIISIILGTRLPDRGQKSCTGISISPVISPWGIRLRRRSCKGEAQEGKPCRLRCPLRQSGGKRTRYRHVTVASAHVEARL